MIDLDAIRQRFREEREDGALYWLSEEYPATTKQIISDTEALIAEVEQHAYTIANCLIEKKEGGILGIDTAGRLVFDGYAIVPRERFEILLAEVATLRAALEASGAAELLASNEVRTLRHALVTENADASEIIVRLRAKVERNRCRCGHMLADHTLTGSAILECPACVESSEYTFICVPDETGKWGQFNL